MLLGLVYLFDLILLVLFLTNLICNFTTKQMLCLLAYRSSFCILWDSFTAVWFVSHKLNMHRNENYSSSNFLRLLTYVSLCFKCIIYFKHLTAVNQAIKLIRFVIVVASCYRFGRGQRRRRQQDKWGQRHAGNACIGLYKRIHICNIQVIKFF